MSGKTLGTATKSVICAQDMRASCCLPGRQGPHLQSGLKTRPWDLPRGSLRGPAVLGRGAVGSGAREADGAEAWSAPPNCP